MATSNINKMSIYTAFKKNCLIELSTLLRHCHIFEKVLSIGCNNKNKLKVTFQFPLPKGTFN